MMGRLAKDHPHHCDPPGEKCRSQKKEETGSESSEGGAAPAKVDVDKDLSCRSRIECPFPFDSPASRQRRYNKRLLRGRTLRRGCPGWASGITMRVCFAIFFVIVPLHFGLVIEINMRLPSLSSEKKWWGPIPKEITMQNSHRDHTPAWWHKSSCQKKRFVIIQTHSGLPDHGGCLASPAAASVLHFHQPSRQRQSWLLERSSSLLFNDVYFVLRQALQLGMSTGAGSDDANGFPIAEEQERKTTICGDNRCHES